MCRVWHWRTVSSAESANVPRAHCWILDPGWLPNFSNTSVMWKLKATSTHTLWLDFTERSETSCVQQFNLSKNIWIFTHSVTLNTKEGTGAIWLFQCGNYTCFLQKACPTYISCTLQYMCEGRLLSVCAGFMWAKCDRVKTTTFEKVQLLNTRCPPLHWEVQCLCTKGLKFPHHTEVNSLRDHDWHDLVVNSRSY